MEFKALIVPGLFGPGVLTKTWRIMRLTALFIFLICMQVSARSYSQKVTLTERDASLQDIFKAIHAQTGYQFFYDDALLDKAGKVSIIVKDVPVAEVLTECLKDLPISFSIEDKSITLQEKIVVHVNRLDSLPTSGITVTGRVSDEHGAVLAGASVSVKNGKAGTLTNEKGIFVLKKVAPNAVLEISFTGYKLTEVLVGRDKGMLAVELPLANSSLDASEVIAYGTTTDRLSTGDVTVVKAAEIELQPVGNVLSAIEGRVPGLFITQSSGLPGTSFGVQLRGENSISNGNRPFYVVDGVPYPILSISSLSPGGGNPLDFINPLDIESISVLKDADATAIYGSRAANGAILITTKKSAGGKTRVDVNVQEGTAKAPERVQWMNTAEYLQMRHEAFNNDSVAPTISSAPDLLYWDTTRYTNWQKAMIGNAAHYTDAQANLSGGNINTQYVLGGNYHRETTVFPLIGSNQKVAAHFSLSTSSSDQKFKATATASYMVNSMHLPSQDLTPFIHTAPDAPPVKNPDGTLNWADETWPSGNPIASTLVQYQSQANNLVSNLLLSYHLFDGLIIKSSVGYNDVQINELSTNPIAAQDPIYSPLGSANFAESYAHSWIAEPQVDYNAKFGSHKIEVLAGSTFEDNVTRTQLMLAYNYTSDELITDPQAAGNLQLIYVDAEYKYNAIFGKVNYNYQDKFIADFSVRRDGSSRFGPGNQWHDFEAAGVAYIFSKEDFIQKTFPFLSYGKLRGSYGTTGNDQIGDYGYYNLFQASSTPYAGIGTLSPVGLTNPYLAWEKTKKLEGAIDLGFLRDRIMLKSNYYYNRSSNELLQSPVPQITGFSTVLENLPATVQNTGWEFTLNTTNIKSKDVWWTSSINLTIPRNKLIAFPNLSNSPYAGSLVIGKPIGVKELYHLDGVDPQTGIYQFKDYHGNTTFSPSYTTDRTSYVNSLFPKYYGGFQNSVGIKEWQLDVFFQFRNITGLNPALQIYAPGSLVAGNLPTAFLHRWQKPGDNSQIEKLTTDYGGAAATALSYAQQSDGSYTRILYARLSNLSLSYQLKGAWLKQARLQSCKFYIHAQNLLVISKYKGVDPETQSFGALPPLRVVTGGILLSL
jgi:TonB-dependent starch-binding outer membrane protein SusC